MNYPQKAILSAKPDHKEFKSREKPVFKDFTILLFPECNYVR
ncbi:hypothetical protein ASZ90_006139 [hydrocarbon metagenome]|uniref:Uncharacterized protein n=1 Tax=hydrocarbon metagenome TaxID=938273 RepID=A0A0W8FT16_9ZZZZ